MGAYLSVKARTDIFSASNLCIAKEGARGRAVKGARPHEANNFGKVLVHFVGRQKGYWCDPSLIVFPPATCEDKYIALKVEYDPYAGAMRVPSDKAVYSYDFGKALKLCREARSLSQAELGRVMGDHGPRKPLAQSTICYRERCRHSPGGQFVEAAAKALQVPAFVFFMNLDDGKIFVKARNYINNLSSAVCNA